MPKPHVEPNACFLNIPYDKQFENLYLAYIVGLTAFDLVPKATLGVPRDARRLERIFQLIQGLPLFRPRYLADPIGPEASARASLQHAIRIRARRGLGGSQPEISLVGRVRRRPSPSAEIHQRPQRNGLSHPP